MYQSAIAWISLCIALLVCGLAIWKGDRWIRFVAIVYVIGWIATPFVALRDPLRPEWGVMVIDVAVMVLLVWASLRSRRLWSLFAAACQMMCVASHLVSIIDLRIYIATLIAGLGLLSYGVLLALLAGTLLGLRERRTADDQTDRPGS